MSVKIFIKRTVSEGKVPELTVLLKRLSRLSEKLIFLIKGKLKN